MPNALTIFFCMGKHWGDRYEDKGHNCKVKKNLKHLSCVPFFFSQSHKCMQNSL